MQFAESLVQQFPAAAADLQPLADLYSKRRWHELTQAVLALLQHPLFQQGDFLPTLYYQFVKSFADKINPLSLSRIIVAASRRMPDADAAAFINDALGAMPTGEKEGRIVLMSRKAELVLRAGSPLEAKRVLDETKAELDATAMADPLAHSAYYGVAMDLFKQHGPAGEFYRAGLAFLDCTPQEQLAPAQAETLAVDMALSALLAEDVYNFGELTQCTVFSVLQKSAHEWLARMVMSFAHGDIAAFETQWQAAGAQIDRVPSLRSSEAALRQKLVVLALMDMVFARGSGERVLSFDAIVQRTRVPPGDVERMVMRALALGLVRGHIDEVARTVTVTWVRPRVLDHTQLQALQQRVSEWATGVGRMAELLEGETRDLAM